MHATPVYRDVLALSSRERVPERGTPILAALPTPKGAGAPGRHRRGVRSSANAATRVFSVSSSDRSVKRSDIRAAPISRIRASRGVAHTPAATSSRRRIAVRNAEDQPMAYPSAATRAPTASSGAAARTSRVVFSILATFWRLRFRDVAISETLERPRPARCRQVQAGVHGDDDPTRVGAFAASLARTSTRLSGPARHATCAAVSRAGRPPRRPETPPPQTRAWTIAGTATASWPRAVLPRRSPRERTRARHLETMARVLRVSFASRRRFPCGARARRLARPGPNPTSRRTTRRADRPRGARATAIRDGELPRGHVAEADGDATGVGGIAPVSRRAHAGTPATARGRAPPRARARPRRVPRPNATWRPPIGKTRGRAKKRASRCKAIVPPAHRLSPARSDRLVRLHNAMYAVAQTLAVAPLRARATAPRRARAIAPVRASAGESGVSPPRRAGGLRRRARGSGPPTRRARWTRGAVAPDFALPATGGGSVALADVVEVLKYAVLYFYNQDFSQGCSIEAERFNQALGDFKAKGATVVGVSMDPMEKHEEFCTAKGRGVQPPVGRRARRLRQVRRGPQDPYPRASSPRRGATASSTMRNRRGPLARARRVPMANVKTPAHTTQILDAIGKLWIRTGVIHTASRRSPAGAVARRRDAFSARAGTTLPRS